MRTVTRCRLLPAVATVASLVVALASPAGADVAAKKAKNSCGLLTAAEIQRTFGVPVAEGQKARDVAGTRGHCEWQVGDPDGDGENGNLTARFERGKNAKPGFDTAKKINGGAVKVTGLGKDAYYSAQTGVLDVLKNNKTALFLSATIFQPGLTAARKDPSQLQSQLEGLAKTALGRA